MGEGSCKGKGQFSKRGKTTLQLKDHETFWCMNLIWPMGFQMAAEYQHKVKALNIIELDTCLSDKTFPFIKNSYWASPQLGSRGSQALLCGPELPTACGLSMSHHRPTFPGWNMHGWKGFNVACSHSCLEMLGVHSQESQKYKVKCLEGIWGIVQSNAFTSQVKKMKPREEKWHTQHRAACEQLD